MSCTFVKEHTRRTIIQGRRFFLHSRQKGGECVNIIKDTQSYEGVSVGTKGRRAHIRLDVGNATGAGDMTGAVVCPVAAGREGNHQSENDCMRKASLQCAGKAISWDTCSFISMAGN